MRQRLENSKFSNLQNACHLTNHTSHARVVSRVTRSTIVRVYVCVFVYYMVCGRIDIRARVNYFSRNSELRYRLRNPCATGYASKVNIMHFSSLCFPPYLLLPLSPPVSLFSLLSPFSRATKGGFVARRSSTKPYTHPPRHGRRLAEFLECYKRVRARAIRQRCNAVPRAPLSSRRISCFVDFVSSIRPTRAKENSRGTYLVNALTRTLPDHERASPFISILSK